MTPFTSSSRRCEGKTFAHPLGGSSYVSASRLCSVICIRKYVHALSEHQIKPKLNHCIFTICLWMKILLVIYYMSLSLIDLYLQVDKARRVVQSPGASGCWWSWASGSGRSGCGFQRVWAGLTWRIGMDGFTPRAVIYGWHFPSRWYSSLSGKSSKGRSIFHSVLWPTCDPQLCLI